MPEQERIPIDPKNPKVIAYFANVKDKGFSPPTCYCRCTSGGMLFRSHCYVAYSGGLSMHSEKPCPKCGSHTNVYRISSDPERFIVRG